MNDPFDGILSRDQIRTLISVAEQGSFQRAAAELGVQQPAVNQLVKRLESRVGRRLFDRTPTGSTLTLDGEAALIYARAMAKLGADMSRHFSETTGETVLRIGIGEEFSRTALPAVLAHFGRLHRSFRFEAVCVSPSIGLFDLLDDGRLDVVVARRHPRRLSGATVWSEPTLWKARKDLPHPIDDPVPLVLPGVGALRDMILTALGGASRTWRVVFEGGSLSILEAAVRAGFGISACTARLELTDAHPLGETSGLPALPPSVFVVERAQPARSDAAEAFCDILQTAAGLSFAVTRTASDAGTPNPSREG